MVIFPELFGDPLSVCVHTRVNAQAIERSCKYVMQYKGLSSS